MANVSSLILLANSLLVKFDKKFTDEQIVLLNEAKFEVFKILVGYNYRSNRFVKLGASAINLVRGTREYTTLPEDLYQLRGLETQNAATRHYRFWYDEQNGRSEQFQDLRADTDAHPTEIPYIVVGEEPGTLVLAASPIETVAVKPWYVYKPPEWDSKDDPIDFMPRSSRLPIARYAAAQFRLGAGSAAWGGFRREWADEVNRMVYTDTRDLSAAPVVMGAFEGEG